MQYNEPVMMTVFEIAVLVVSLCAGVGGQEPTGPPTGLPETFTIKGTYNSNSEWRHILSPGFPNSYPSFEVRWFIQNEAPDGGIQLVFDDFDLEPNDLIMIDDPRSGQLVYDGRSRMRPTFECIYPNMTLTFRPTAQYDHSVKHGFRLTLRFIRASPGSRWQNQPDTSYDRLYIGPHALHSRTVTLPSNSGLNYIDTVLIVGVPQGYEGLYIHIQTSTDLRGVVNGWGNGNFFEVRQGNVTTAPLIVPLVKPNPASMDPSTQLYPIYYSPVLIRVRGGFHRGRKLSLLITALSMKECGLYSDQFRCQNDMCIANTLVSNGFRNCPDGSDEIAITSATHAPTPPTMNCLVGKEFACSNKCIPKIAQCDGRFDCEDLSDEMGCEFFCKGFTCLDKLQCVGAKSVCDGSYTCLDRSDEIGCPNTTPKPPKRTTNDMLDSSTTALFVGALGIIACLLFAIILVMVRRRIIRCDKCRQRNRRPRRGRAGTHLNVTVNNIASVHGLPPTYDEAVYYNHWTGEVNLAYSAENGVEPPPYTENVEVVQPTVPGDQPPEYSTLDLRATYNIDDTATPTTARLSANIMNTNMVSEIAHYNTNPLNTSASSDSSTLSDDSSYRGSPIPSRSSPDSVGSEPVVMSAGNVHIMQSGNELALNINNCSQVGISRGERFGHLNALVPEQTPASQDSSSPESTIGVASSAARHTIDGVGSGVQNEENIVGDVENCEQDNSVMVLNNPSLECYV